LASAVRSAFGWQEKTDGDGNPVPYITDDLIVEILSRLPPRSVCRFKCVSRYWLHDLITHPDFRAKIPQTLTGFFRCNGGDYGDDVHGYPAEDEEDDNDVHGYDFAEDDVHGYDSGDDVTLSVPDFMSIVGEKEHKVISPSLSFLPDDVYRSICVKHCSDGLLVCLCWKVSPTNESDYVVCNPATQQWVTVPGNGHRDRSIMPLHLEADPASASGHYHLFAILNSDLACIAGVDIYSSETGAWSHHETGWAKSAMLFDLPHSVFLQDMLHLVTMDRSIVAVDTKGLTWKTIRLPQDMESEYLCMYNVAFIGVSRGCLHYVNNSNTNYYMLRVWMLQGNDNWIPKHTITTQALFGPRSPDMFNIFLIAIHPECNTIFFSLKDDQKLMSYDMDQEETRVHGILSGGWEINPYLPYVPSWRSIPL
jgi:hypothetical protein